MYADINNEVCEYKEKVFMGLSLDQVVVGILAITAEVLAFLLLRKFNLNLVVMMIIHVLVALPFGAVLVVQYNKMGFVKLSKVMFKYLFLQDKTLRFGNNNRWNKVLNSIEKERER